MKSVRLAGMLSTAPYGYRVVAPQFMLADNDEGRSSVDIVLDRERESVRDIAARYRSRFYEEFQRTWGAYMSASHEVLDLIRRNETVPAMLLAQEKVGPLYAASAKALDNLIEQNMKNGRMASQLGDDTHRSSIDLILGALGTAPLVGTATAPRHHAGPSAGA